MGSKWIATITLSALLASMGVGTASAEEAVHDTALAHELFDKGRALMAAKQYERACETFEESRKVDPGHAGGTLLNLALCREISGKTATAWALFREARGVAIRDQRDDRRSFAEEHIAALAPRLSRLRISVPASAHAPGLVVKRNGVVLAESAWGEALLTDPGPQVVEATAPGKRLVHLEVAVTDDGKIETITIPALENEPAGTAGETKSPPRAASLFAGPQRISAVAVGAAGLFAAGIGGLYGVLAVRKQRDANALCPNYDRCDPRGLTLSADAVDDARIATALVVSGAVVFGIGVVLFLTAPKIRGRDTTLAAALSGGDIVPTFRF